MSALEEMLRSAFRAGELWAYVAADRATDTGAAEDEDAAVARIMAESEAADQ